MRKVPGADVSGQTLLSSEPAPVSSPRKGPGNAQAEALGRWGRRLWAQAQPGPGGCGTRRQPRVSGHSASEARRAEWKRALPLPWQPAPTPGVRRNLCRPFLTKIGLNRSFCPEVEPHLRPNKDMSNLVGPQEDPGRHPRPRGGHGEATGHVSSAGPRGRRA